MSSAVFKLEIDFFKNKTQDRFARYFLEQDEDDLIDTILITDRAKNSISLTVSEVVSIGENVSAFFANDKDSIKPKTIYSWGSGYVEADIIGNTVTLIEQSDGVEIDFDVNHDFMPLLEAVKKIKLNIE